MGHQLHALERRIPRCKRLPQRWFAYSTRPYRAAISSPISSSAEPVSSLARFLVLACAKEPYRQSDAAHRVVDGAEVILSFGDKPLVGDACAARRKSIRQMYVAGKSMRSIAAKLNLSVQRVHKIIAASNGNKQ